MLQRPKKLFFQAIQSEQPKQILQYLKKLVFFSKKNVFVNFTKDSVKVYICKPPPNLKFCRNKYILLKIFIAMTDIESVQKKEQQGSFLTSVV